MISMKKVNYAAIDIGSNAVRLLIKCVNEENAPELMSKVQLIRIPLRLGEDAFTMGVISAEKEKKLIRLMKAYKQLMKIYDVVDYRACATSAMRDARNGKDIVRQIAKKTGIRVDIIDGQEEAHIVYDNHIEQLFASGQNYLYVDVGGGSTEINLISNGGPCIFNSIGSPIGAYFTTVTSAPRINPISRKCCLSAPLPPTDKIIPFCPMPSSFNVIIFTPHLLVSVN